MGESTVTVAALPQNITFDRVLVHPAPCQPSGYCNYVARGFELDAVNGTVMYSNIWDIVNPYQDAQAIGMQNTTGPYLIAGNYLEATGENVITNTSCTGAGYAGSGIPDCPVPSDGTVRLNHFIKQIAWQTLPAGCNGTPGNQCYDVKNQLEWKHGQRVLVDSNIFDTTFLEGQSEFVIMNCLWTGPYVCNDVTITNNLFEHGPDVFVLGGNGTTQTGQRILLRNNMGYDIDGAWAVAGTYGLFGQFQNTGSLTIDHNTLLNQPPTYMTGISLSDAPPSTDTSFQYTNNLIYAPFFADGMDQGQAIAALPSPVLGQDVFVGDWWPNLNAWGGLATPAYPAGIFTATSTATPVAGQPACNYDNKPIAQCWPLDWATVGLVDFPGASLGTDLPGMALSPSSPYHEAGTDGMDIGANISAVLAAIATVP
jgi:hypothetical protein